MEFATVFHNLGLFTLGVLLDQLFWRHRYGVQRADSAADGRAALLRSESEPLLAALAALIGELEQLESGARAFRFLIAASDALHQGAARLAPHLPDDHRASLLAAMHELCEGEQCHADRDTALAQARSLQRMVLGLHS